MQDMAFMRKEILKAQKEKKSVPVDILTLFENVAFLMTKHADPSLEANTVEISIHAPRKGSDNATYKDVSHGIENFSQLVSYTGMMGGANLIETPALDSIQINASNIRITTNTDVSASYVYLVLRYTKTTD